MGQQQTTTYIMSFILRRAALAPRVFAVQAPRTFTTSFAAQKTASEVVKDAAKKVDGIEAGETATGKVKETAQDISGSEVTGKTAELKGEAKGKASELKGEAKGAAKEAKGKVKGAAEEIKNKL